MELFALGLMGIGIGLTIDRVDEIETPAPPAPSGDAYLLSGEASSYYIRPDSTYYLKSGV